MQQLQAYPELTGAYALDVSQLYQVPTDLESLFNEQTDLADLEDLQQLFDGEIDLQELLSIPNPVDIYKTVMQIVDLFKWLFSPQPDPFPHLELGSGNTKGERIANGCNKLIAKLDPMIQKSKLIQANKDKAKNLYSTIKSEIAKYNRAQATPNKPGPGRLNAPKLKAMRDAQSALNRAMGQLKGLVDQIYRSEGLNPPFGVSVSLMLLQL